jgi:hypothetical protein
MHFVFLTEDQSSAKSLEILLPRLTHGNTFDVHSYRGGHKDITKLAKQEPQKRIFFDRLPELIRGFGKTFNAYGAGYKAALIVICDLDDRDKDTFLSELKNILNSCPYKPDTYFCLSIEEYEAWYLGDLKAIERAYPLANKKILRRYKNDSICGTWELLADAVYKGGCQALKKLGRRHIGIEKSNWAAHISPHMNIKINKSPSFQYLIKCLLHIMK